MTGIVIAWLVGEGIITYRVVHYQHRAPLPAEVLASSGFFVLAAGVAEINPTVGTLLAVGVDIAAVMNLFGNPATAKSVAADQAANIQVASAATSGPVPKRTVR